MISRVGLPKSEESYDLAVDEGRWDDIAKDPDKQKNDIPCNCFCPSSWSHQAVFFVIAAIS